MSTKEETKEKVKNSWFSLKNLCTGIVCAAVSAGVSIGLVDTQKLQETITAAQARQVAIAAAAYSAEQAATSVLTIVKSDVSLAEKASAITTSVASAVASTKNAADSIIAGVTSDAASAGLTQENVTAVGEGAAAVKDTITNAADTAKAKVTGTDTSGTTPPTATTEKK